MYTLQDRDGYPVLNTNGTPFLYSAEWLARIGKKVLEKSREEKDYRIVHQK